jgi:tetratricopeptide (TPR) repeat protein
MTVAAQPRSGARLSVAGLIAVVLLLFVAYRHFLPSTQSDIPKPGRIWGTGAPQNASEALEKLRRDAATGEQRGATRGNDWLSWQDAAAAWIGIGRLTGDPAAYARADAALAKGFAIAQPGAGPHGMKATLDLALHRLNDAQSALSAISHYMLPDPAPVRADQTAMRADIAFYRGHTDEAARLYGEALSLSKGPETLCRISNFQWRTGQLDEAKESLARCEASVPMRTPQFAAYVAAQRGIMALNEGNWEAAEREFSDANSLFPGEWRTELRLELMRAALGNPANATKHIEALARSESRPEVADALANLYRLSGNGPRSREWSARAGSIWDRWAGQYPLAFAGHARDHELAFGSPAKALRYATIDVRNRPFGEALIGLARAWIANDRPDFALALTEKAKRTGWVSAEAERIRAEALALLGRGAEEKEARRSALAIDPRNFDPARANVWLDH